MNPLHHRPASPPLLPGLLRRARHWLNVTVTITLLASLAACGGGGGGPDTGTAGLDPLLADAPDYGSSTLPKGAALLTLDEFKTWAGKDTLHWFTAAEGSAAVAAWREQQAADKALVDAAVAQNPRLARLLALTPTSGGALTVGANGSRSIVLADQTRIRLDGADTLTGRIAHSLRRTNARANMEAAYLALYPMLPLDQRDGLPAPEALASTADADLLQARGQLVRRLELFLPNDDAPPLPAALSGSTAALRERVQAAAPRARAQATDSITQCKSPGFDDWSNNYTWALKTDVPPMRSQGNRGTCVAHAALAGVETYVRRHRGRLLDLSEQALYSTAKYDWFRTADDYAEGLPAGSLLDKMVDTQKVLMNESAWAYNPSSVRVEDEAASLYTHSCYNYGGFCSDTNHQREQQCTLKNGQQVCAYKLPAEVTGTKTDYERLTSHVSLWDHLAPEDSITAVRAMVAAGKPVLLEFLVDTEFAEASDPRSPSYTKLGLVFHNPDSEIVNNGDGGHAALVVGFISNAQLPTAYHDSLGGYLVVKNSWGCRGDQGYWYVPYTWAVDRVQGAHAITGVHSSVAQPQFSLAVSKSVIKTPADLKFVLSGNVTARSIKYWLATGNGPVATGNTAGSSPWVETFNGLGLFAEGKNFVMAEVQDEGGTTYVTNWVSFVVDTEPPTVTLSASSTTVATPGDVTLTADAQDASGIAEVRFYRGLTLIGTVTSAPWQLNYHFPQYDMGTTPFMARATDKQGRQRYSPFTTVTSVGLVKPIVGSFTATPGDLQAPGGNVTLSWSVLGASTVSIDNGVGTQPATGSTTVAVGATSTTYTLTATNSKGSTTAQALVVVHPVLPPQIQSFTATPASLPFGGGSTTLAWSFLGAAGDSVVLSPGVGDVTGQSSRTVNLSASTTYTLTATNAGGTRTRTLTVAVAGDTTAPSVSLAGNASSFTTASDLKLSATASDNAGVTRVEFYRGATLLGSVSSAPYAWSVPLTVADNGTLTFTAKAYDEAGNSATSTPLSVTVAIPVLDTTAPSVSLAASSLAVTAPATVSLTASASDNVGVNRVEFYEGATLLATRTSVPYALDVTYAAANAGTHTYVAVAFDGAGNNAASTVLTVTVSAPASVDRFVDAAAGSNSNDGLSAATAYKTLTKAMSTVGANGTVWLANGSYPPENSPANANWQLTVPAGITVRAATDGGATLGFGLLFAGSGGARGLVFDGVNPGQDMSGIEATAGTVALRNLAFSNIGSAIAGPGGFGARAAIKARGTAVLTLDLDDANAVVFGGGVYNAVLAYESGQLTINGGRIAPTAVWCNSENCWGQFRTGGSAQLTLNGMTLAVMKSNAVSGTAAQPQFLLQDTSKVTIAGATITQTGTGTQWRDLALPLGTSTLAINSSTVGSTFKNLVGLRSGLPSVRLSQVTVNGVFTDNVIGRTDFATSVAAAVSLTNSSFSSFNGSGAVLNLEHGGSLIALGSSFSGNARAINLAGTTSTYTVTVGQSSFTNNGNCARPGCYALALEGAAGSSFNLGTAASPGTNTFTAPTAATGVVVKAGSVSAVGNTWAAGLQGANASGQYVLGSAPCSASSCAVTSGTGVNYVITGGSLTLAGN
jgi:hypothetical protein